MDIEKEKIFIGALLEIECLRSVISELRAELDWPDLNHYVRWTMAEELKSFREKKNSDLKDAVDDKLGSNIVL